MKLRLKQPLMLDGPVSIVSSSSSSDEAPRNRRPGAVAPTAPAKSRGVLDMHRMLAKQLGIWVFGIWYLVFGI